MSRSEYPAPFLKKDSFRALREDSFKMTREALQQNSEMDEDEMQRKGETHVQFFFSFFSIFS